MAATALPGGTLEVRQHARKGRCLHTTRLVKAGEVVLSEAPVLLLAAPDMAHTTCAACLRALELQGGIQCPGCQQASFCSPRCQQAAGATAWGHSAPICSAYARLGALGPGTEEHAQLRFLLHAMALRHANTPEAGQRFASLLGLVGEPTDADMAAAARLLPILTQALSGTAAAGLCFSQAEAAALLRKEQLNSYGVLATRRQAEAARDGAGAAGRSTGCGAGAGGSQPAAGGGGGEEDAQDGERHLRGSALYAQAALINHECLPNVARYDSFDAPLPPSSSPSASCQGGSSASGSGGTGGAGGCSSSSSGGGSSSGCSTHVVFRALHDLPPGTEVTTSYVPLHWGLRERQAQCREVYGFACTCPRCQTESQWSDDEGDSEWETDSEGASGEGAEEGMEGEGGDEGPGSDDEVEMEEALGPITAPPGEDGPLEPAYLRLFLLKYMCARPGCFGTAAPPAPGSPLLECNVCGATRSEQDFLRELQAGAGASAGRK